MKTTEIFYSIEGEGIQIGKPQIFIRLTGCNLSCKWCDTKYAWQNGKEMSIEDIIESVKGYPCKCVSLTGGEPLCQNKEVLELVKELKALGYWVQINTNGSFFDKGVFELVDFISMDCKCPSSGMVSDKEVLRKTKELYNDKTQFKFVVSDEADYARTKEVMSWLNPLTVVIQPEWTSRKFTNRLVESAKKDGLCARIIVQQHKLIWGNRNGI